MRARRTDLFRDNPLIDNDACQLKAFCRLTDYLSVLSGHVPFGDERTTTHEEWGKDDG